MAKMVLQGGFYFKELKASVDISILNLSKRLEAAPGDRKKLASLREELGGIGRKLSNGMTYDELLYANARLGAMERELAMLEFAGKKMD